MSVVVVPKIACANDCPDDINDSVPAQAGHAGEFLSTDGSVVSWQPASGGTPTGDANTLAYFNASGNLDSDTKLKFNVTPYSISYGPETSTGVITATGNGSWAHGQTTGAGNITASGVGTEASGNVSGGSIVASTNSGGKAFGNAVAGTMTASGNGSIARGNLAGAGVMTASASGSHVAGATDLGTFTASAAGSMAAGGITGVGSLIASGTSGSLAMGGITTATISATASGTFAQGVSQNSALITATSSGGMARGNADTSGTIQATNNGSIASGRSTTSGFITSSGLGSLSMGDAVAGSVVSSGAGAHAHGQTSSSGTMTASGPGAITAGFSDGASSTMLANNRGSIAAGSVDAASTLQSTQHGAFAHGSATSGGFISSSGVGSEAAGTSSVGSISSAGVGSKAFGSSTGVGSQVHALSLGSLSFGQASAAGVVSADGSSATFGRADGTSTRIETTTGVHGALVFGDANSGGVITSQSGASLVYGYSQVASRNIIGNNAGVYAAGTTIEGSVQVYGVGGFGHGSDIDSAARYSGTFGIGHANDSYGSLYIGQYSTSPGYSENTYVTTDPVLVIGNGADGSNRSNAVRVLKNGQFEIYGPLRLQGSTSGYTGFQSAATGGSTTFTVPSADGTSGQVLTTNGSGILSFSTPAASASLSGLTAATGTNTIENVNFAQAWEWDSLTTQTALQLSSSSMTSGTIFKVVDTRNNADNTGNIVRIESSGGTASAAKLLSLSHDGNAAAARGITLTMTGGSAAYVGLDLDLASQSSSIGVKSVMSDQSNNGAPKAVYGQVDSQNSGAIAGSFVLTGVGGAAAGTAVKAEVTDGVGLPIDALGTASGIKQVARLQNTVAAANDSAARVGFSANRTTGGLTDVAGVAGMITDITNATYKGALVFQTANATAPDEKMRIKHDGSLLFPFTNTTAGTTGNQTINKISGTVNFATAASSVTVTNNLVTANSLVFAVVRTNDATAVIKNVVPGSGSFVITLNAAATAETSVGFWVINQ